MAWNIGVILGPILGGVLSDPAGSYPEWFGNIQFFNRYPYAPPNILSALIVSIALIGVFLGLEEVGKIDSLIVDRLLSQHLFANKPYLPSCCFKDPRSPP